MAVREKRKNLACRLKIILSVGLFFILKSVILVTQSVPKKSQAKRIGYSLDNREAGENPARSRHCKQ